MDNIDNFLILVGPIRGRFIA